MNKKLFKLIMELIFIFILPLGFIALGVEIKKSYTYDSNGNVVNEDKYVDIKNIDFLNDETLEYSKYNYTIVNNGTTLNNQMYFSLRALMLNNGICVKMPYTINEQTYNVYCYYKLYSMSQNGSWNTPIYDASNRLVAKNNQLYLWVILSLNSNLQINTKLLNSYDIDQAPYHKEDLLNNDYIINGYWTYGLDLSGDTTFNNIDYVVINDNNIKDIYITIGRTEEKFNQYFMNNELVNSEIDIGNNKKLYSVLNITKEEYILNNNPISNILNQLFGVLGIQQNVITQLLVIYVLLWVIMFLVWHLLYRFVDFMVHLFDKKE